MLTYAFIWFSDGWKFIAPIYYNLFWSVHYSSIVMSIICLATIKVPDIRLFGIVLGIIISMPIFFLTFNPIDRYDYPHDIKILDQTSEYKTVVRQTKSGKTNQIKIDTVKVIDEFIFRKLITE